MREGYRPAPARRGWREAVLALAAAGTAILAFGALADVPAVRGLEVALLDLRFRWRGPLPADPSIVVVMVDDESLAALGRWPLSRRYFAQAVTMLGDAGARAVAFDLLFTEAERPLGPDPARLLREAAVSLPASPLKSALEQIANDDPDADFAAAIAHMGHVLLPFALRLKGAAGAAPDADQGAAFVRFLRTGAAPQLPVQPVAMTAPIDRLAAAARGLGHVDILYDVDSAPRYDYAALPFDGDFYPSLAVRIAAEALGVPWDEVGLAPGSGIEMGARTLPTDRAMRYQIDYRGPPQSFPTYSFVDLVRGRVPAKAVQGRLVLIGGSFTGNADSNPQPYGQALMPGVERLASAVATILDGAFLVEPPAAWRLAIGAALLVAAGGLGFAIAYVPTRVALPVALAPILVWTMAAQAAFDRGVVIPMAAPLAALAAAGSVVMLFRYWVVERDGRIVRAQFRRYLAPEMVDLLAQDPSRLKLGGETRIMTYLFCDVRGFTAISEALNANPSALTRLINRFLTPMTEAVMARGGTIDKYMGDCIMAFWNAPLDDADHARHACQSALDMLAALERLNRELATETLAGAPATLLRIGIGLNSGPAVVGNMGSDRRFDYSVLGDAVNLASRLEGQSKYYGVDIVIGEATQSLAPEYATLELDRIAVKGKREPARIFALLGDPERAGTADFVAAAERHRALLERYRARDWAGALAALQVCRRLRAEMAAVYDLYQARIEHFRADPPPDDWDGVFVAVSK